MCILKVHTFPEKLSSASAVCFLVTPKRKSCFAVVIGLGSCVDIYSPFPVTRIKDSTARRDAERLGKAERSQLPRVTAYATANSYDLDGLVRFLKARASTRGSMPKKFDECVYTPFSYSHKTLEQQQQQQLPDLIDLNGGIEELGHVQSGGEQSHDVAGEEEADGDWDTRSLREFVDRQNESIVTSDVFLFQYGVVVIWGMSVTDEARFLRDIAKFEMEKLSDDDVQVENFNFYVTDSYQPRIYNDFIALRDGRNYMVKLSISHAIAQSVKVGLALFVHISGE